MGGKKVKCEDCSAFNNINFCKVREIFVNSKKGKYCQDFNPGADTVAGFDKKITALAKTAEEVLIPEEPKGFWARLLEKFKEWWYTLWRWKKP